MVVGNKKENRVRISVDGRANDVGVVYKCRVTWLGNFDSMSFGISLVIVNSHGDDQKIPKSMKMNLQKS